MERSEAEEGVNMNGTQRGAGVIIVIIKMGEVKSVYH